MLFAELAALFIAGMCQDTLNTLYVRAIADHRRGRAMLLSGVLTVTGFLIFARVLAHFEANMDAASASLLSYALGNSAGTWVGLRGPRA
jgi:hypothetical protein